MFSVWRFDAKAASVLQLRLTPASSTSISSATTSVVAAVPVRKRGLLFAALALVAVVAILAVGYFAGWFSKHGPYTQADLKPQVLTSNSSEDAVSLTSISPDGKYLLFADLEGLHLRLMTTGETQTLPTPDAFCFR